MSIARAQPGALQASDRRAAHSSGLGHVIALRTLVLPVLPWHMHQLGVLPLILASLKALPAPGERALDPWRPLCMFSQDVRPKVSGTGPCNTTVLTHRRFVLATVYLMHVYGQAQLGLIRLLAVRTAMRLRAGAVRALAAQPAEDRHTTSMLRREMGACL